MTASPRACAASSTQKYAAASTGGSKRRPLAESCTARCESPPARARRDPSAVWRPERASWAGKTPRVISRRFSSAALSESTSGVRAAGSSSGVAARAGTDRSVSWSGSGVRCWTTCRAMDRSSRLRSASPAVTSRRRDPESSRLRRLSSSTSPESSAVSRALRKASPAWSARSARSCCSRGRRGWPARISTVMLPSRSPRSATGISTLADAGPSALSGGQTAVRSGPAWTCRRTLARLAFTAWAAASATAGSRSAGSGLSPRRRLKSASASYGAAAAPKASRSATLTTRRRSGWKAMATTAVASSDGQNRPALPPTASPTSTTTST